MSYGPSDEVAEDYRKALEDLTINSRYEISNLTVIAKENTEHAFAIAEALKLHIKQTAPAKKLPAFYVLDSVVKNVGTPYTLFFGRQLYSTFMEAYALVDNSVRRKMDEMLKTWKEPVPGSMDTRPVFPPEVTRPIENALIKAKTSFLQTHQENMRNQQQMGRGRPMSAAPYQQTPTPPNGFRPPPNQIPGYGPNYQQQTGPYPPPQSYPNQQNGSQPYGLPPRPPPQQQPQQGYPPQNSGGWQQPAPQQAQGYYEADNSVEKLNSDLDALINASKIEWSQRPADTSIGTRLKALLDLQTILRNQTLPPEQITQIKQQVEQLSQASQAAAMSQPSHAPNPPPAPVVAPQIPAAQPSLSSILGPGALAALLARSSATPQPAAPQIRSPQPPQVQPFYQPPPANVPAVTPIPNASSLLDSLRAAGLLGASVPPPPNSMPGFPPPPFLGTPPNNSRTALAEIPNDVVLKPTSLKIPRPHLISSLYEKLGVPCTQCGRRFQLDEEGKKKKEAHMDWHFKVRRRMEEAETRGQHRSWYVDDIDWIRSRETDDESGATTTDASTAAGTSSAAAGPKLQYLPVPDDPALKSSVCPICQEEFDTKYLDDVQEWVWMDAKQIGDKIYHATCYAEATKDVNSQIKRGTPEPVLGKRKAEDDYMPLRTKIKTETA